MNYNRSYIVFHWFMHFLFAHILMWVTNFRLIGYYSFTFDFLGYTVIYNIFDYLIVFTATGLIDLDHSIVLRKFGVEGLLKFAKKRITYPLHNFLIFGIFSFLSAVFAIINLRVISILLLSPVVHIFWDMIEDAVIFKSSYRKWEKTWGVGTKELEEMWKELKRLEKAQQ